MAELQKVECPHCGKNFELHVRAIIPDSQVISLRIESESQYLSAEVAAQIMQAQAQALRQSAKALGTDVVVFLKYSTVTDGAVEWDLAVVAKKEGG